MSDKRPNILLITCHDVGRFLGCYGVPTVQTPNLDALAADGIRFTQAFCVAPQCSPSRATLFTGRYPHSNGVMGLTNGPHAWDLKPEEQHLGQVLQGAGYATAVVGMCHELRGLHPEQIAERCGMDEVIRPMPMPREGLSSEDVGPADALSDETLELLARHAEQDEPFYLQLGYLEPHRLKARERDEPDYKGFIGDYISPDDTLGITVPGYLRDTPQAREELAELQGAVHYMDAAIGRVLQGLQELGLDANTLVLFTTDHGVALPRAKVTLYDPGIEVALILRWPARGWTGGAIYSELVSNVDIFPTLLDVLGIPVSDAVQGRSLLSLLDGQLFARRDAIFAEMTYHQYYDPMRCIRTGQYKLILHFCSAPFLMDPSQSWRPRTAPVGPALGPHPLLELYDLANDPWEQQNLADDPAHQTLRDDLLRQLHEWMYKTEDPLLIGAVTSPMHHWAVDLLREASGAEQCSE